MLSGIQTCGMCAEDANSPGVASPVPAATAGTQTARQEPAAGDVAAPYAYLIPAEFRPVVEHLLQRNVEVAVLREDLELEVEVYRMRP